MVYEADGKFISIKNGGVVGVFDNEQDALDTIFVGGIRVATDVDNLYLVADPDEELKKQAKAAYQTFLTKKGYKPSTPKPMLFKMNGKFVTMLNGAVQGIYDTQADAISAVYSGSAPLPTNVENLFILDNFYRWECNGSTATSVGSISSSLTLQSGSVNSDGVYARESICRFEKTMYLDHNKPWVIEWVGKGTAFILTEATTTHPKDFYYLYHKGSQETALCSGKNHPFTHHGYDTRTSLATSVHKNRLENRVNKDGTNMIYWILDDEHEYPLDTNLTEPGASNGWVNGKSFKINYIGGINTYLENYQFESLTVIENRD